MMLTMAFTLPWSKLEKFPLELFRLAGLRKWKQNQVLKKQNW